MKCTCKNEDGTSADLCIGCNANRMMNNNSFSFYQLNQIKDIVREAFSVSISLDKIWSDGFKQGFNEGYKHAKDHEKQEW